MWREEKIWLVCFQKEEYWCAWGVVEESGQSSVHHHTRPWIQSTTQSMTQILRVGKHLRRVMGNDSCSSDWRMQFYVSPYARTRSMLLEFRQCFLKKRIIGVREESWVRERDSENFHVEERMKVIKETREHFGRFFYQEENFNFSPFRRKLKFCTFSCLKFCFKISNI